MIGIIIAVILAALVYALCTALGLPAIVGIVAAILVLLAGVPTGGYGLGNRFGGHRVSTKLQRRLPPPQSERALRGRAEEAGPGSRSVGAPAATAPPPPAPGGSPRPARSRAC